MLILCYSPPFTWSSEQQRLQLHFCHDNHCIMKPSGNFNLAACDTGHCWYVSEQTRDKDIWAERMSLWRLCSAVSSLVPPGHPHHGVFAWIKPRQPQAVWGNCLQAHGRAMVLKCKTGPPHRVDTLEAAACFWATGNSYTATLGRTLGGYTSEIKN